MPDISSSTEDPNGNASPILAGDLPGCRYDVVREGQGLRLRINGRIDPQSTTLLVRDVLPRLNALAPSALSVDLAQVSYLDDFGALLIVEMKRMMQKLNGRLALVHVSDNVKEMLSMLRIEDFAEEIHFTRKHGFNIFIRLGEATLKTLRDFNFLISFVGSVFLSLLHVVRHPRALRGDETVIYMRKIGVDALPIVGLIGFLLGLIMAFMSSIQLRQFGANIYVASLVSLAMVRELGPIMTAIIVAGRSGSAFAAEIGTMRVSEEVDALFTMGFDPTRFLVIPKMVAAVSVVPLLTLFSDLFAILGGVLVGVSILDLTLDAYITQTFNVLRFSDILWSFLKSAVFAMLIAWIGCFRGFQVKGSAADVGEATTSAVVSSIFLIIFSDSVFALLIQYL